MEPREDEHGSWPRPVAPAPAKKRHHFLKSTEFLERHKGIISRTTFYAAVRRGELPHVRVGTTILVPDDALDVMLEEQEARRLASAHNDGDTDE
jgi:excisionase family DNA binding protein